MLFRWSSTLMMQSAFETEKCLLGNFKETRNSFCQVFIQDVEKRNFPASDVSYIYKPFEQRNARLGYFRFATTSCSKELFFWIFYDVIQLSFLCFIVASFSHFVEAFKALPSFFITLMLK